MARTKALTVDLHGCTTDEAMRRVVVRYNEALARHGLRWKLEIIHGYGSGGVGGSIRDAVDAFVDEWGHRGFLAVAAPASAYNPGRTCVKPLLGEPILLPQADEASAGGRGVDVTYSLFG